MLHRAGPENGVLCPGNPVLVHALYKRPNVMQLRWDPNNRRLTRDPKILLPTAHAALAGSHHSTNVIARGPTAAAPSFLPLLPQIHHPPQKPPRALPAARRSGRARCARARAAARGLLTHALLELTLHLRHANREMGSQRRHLRQRRAGGARGRETTVG